MQVAAPDAAPLLTLSPRSEAERRAWVDGYQRLGWTPHPQADGSLILQAPPSLGRPVEHVVLAAATFWTFGLANLLHAARELKAPRRLRILPVTP